MRRIPLLRLAGAALLALAGCDGTSDAPEDPPGSRLPLGASPIPEESFAMISPVGDTLRFRVTASDESLVLTRYRRADRGIDSLVAVIDPESKTPIQSFRRVHPAGGSGSVTAAIHYGRGFDGQARLTLTSPGGQQEDNVRTPPPFLDAAQLPLTLSALAFGADRDSFAFNYVAAFEKRALPARIEVLGLDTLGWRVLLQVSGLREEYWFAAEPPHRLLRIQETTRNVTWTRP